MNNRFVDTAGDESFAITKSEDGSEEEQSTDKPSPKEPSKEVKKPKS